MSRRHQIKYERTEQTTMSGMILGVWLAIAPTTLADSSMSQAVTTASTSRILVAQTYEPPPPEGNSGGRASGGVRGEESSDVCLVSPGVPDRIIFSDLPLFYWATIGDSPNIQMQYIVLIDESGEVLWESALPADAQSIFYQGTALQPGQEYTWRLDWTVGGEQQRSQSVTEQSYQFQVMDAAQRSTVIAELRRQASGVDSESAANRQADYLIEQHLQSDALQVLSAVIQPSSATVQRIKAIVNRACSNTDTPPLP